MKFIFDNWELWAAFILFLFILGITGILTKSIRRAKDGFKELFTPLGVLTMLILLYIGAKLLQNLGIL